MSGDWESNVAAERARELRREARLMLVELPPDILPAAALDAAIDAAGPESIDEEMIVAEVVRDELGLSPQELDAALDMYYEAVANGDYLWVPRP